MKKNTEILSEQHVNELLNGIDDDKDQDQSLMVKNKHLAAQHWFYISELLETTLKKDIYTKEYVMAQCKFHYLSAWEHGAKHYQELIDQENKNA